MREIKFRAWDGKAIREGFVIHQANGRFPLVENKLNVLEPQFEWKVMQYTGLKDKNGVEIYEGDICKIDWNDSRYPTCFGTVRWSDDVCGWDFGDGISSEVNWSHEVVGNIHENQELIHPNKRV